jgi:hypothetical protein
MLKNHSCLRKNHGTMPISVSNANLACYNVCPNSHTAADSITVAIPVYQLTVSPSAAPKQHPRQDQVINGTGYLHMYVTVLLVLVVWVNVRIHFNVRVLYMSSSCDIPTLVTLKCGKSSTTVVKLMTACSAEVKIRWNYTSPIPYYAINLSLHHRRFETHTELYMNIQDEINCDKLSPDGPVTANF